MLKTFIFGVVSISQICGAFAANSEYENRGSKYRSDVRNLTNAMGIFSLQEKKKEKRVLHLPPTSAKIHSAYASTITPSLSLKTSLIPINFPASDQRDLGTCAGFSVVDCLRAVHGRALSQAGLIATAKKLDNCLNDGLTLGLTMTVAHRIGVVRYDAWPYDAYRAAVIAASPVVDSSANLCMTPPVDTKKETKYAFAAVESLFAIDRSACVLGEPCVVDKLRRIWAAFDKYKAPISISIPIKMRDWQTGNVANLSGKADGWHAIMIYGYDPIHRAFHFMNSWGEQWGYKGHGTIPEGYVSVYSSEAWIGYGKKVIPPKPVVPVAKPAAAPAALPAYQSGNELKAVKTHASGTTIYYSRKNLKRFLGYLFKSNSDQTIADKSGIEGVVEKVSDSTIHRLRTDRKHAEDKDYAGVWKALKTNFRSDYQQWREKIIS